MDTAELALLEFRDPRFVEVEQVPKLVPQTVGLGMVKSPVEQAGAKLHSPQHFLEIIAEDLLDLLGESIGGFEVDR